MNVFEAIVRLRPGAEWTMTGVDLATLKWLDTTHSRPTDQEIQTMMEKTAVPASVFMWQAKAALDEAGKLEAANAAVVAAGGATAIAWKHASSISRDSVAVAQMATAIGMSSDDLDAMFLAAGQIVV